MAHILMVITGANYITLKDGSRHPTGYWADEVLVPYRMFTDAGVEVDIATPGGVPAPLDKASLDPQYHGGDAAKARAIAQALEAIPGSTNRSRSKPLTRRARAPTARSSFRAVMVRWKTWPPPHMSGPWFAHLPAATGWFPRFATDPPRSWRAVPTTGPLKAIV